MSVTFEMPGIKKEIIPTEELPEVKALMATQADAFSAFASLEEQMALLEAQLDGIKERMVEAFQRHGVDKIKTVHGSYSLVTRSTKEYKSDVIAHFEDMVKTLKTEAEKRGEYELKPGKPFIKYTKV